VVNAIGGNRRLFVSLLQCDVILTVVPVQPRNALLSRSSSQLLSLPILHFAYHFYSASHAKCRNYARRIPPERATRNSLPESLASSKSSSLHFLI
jgi:hypothetical protein